MIRLAAMTFAALMLAQPALACRVGGASLVFKEVPANPPADHAIVLVHFSNTSRAYRDAATKPRPPGSFPNLIGVATFEDGRTLPVYGRVNSCTHGFFGTPPYPHDGPFILVGKIVGKFAYPKDERFFQAAGYFSEGDQGRWSPVG